MTQPLTIRCPDYEDGTRYTSRYGGNDPDVYPVPARHGFPRGWCESCADSSGWKTLKCDCGAEAVEWFQSSAWCAACVAEERANAFEMEEDV